ncbi:MAG: hypothetical protein ABSB95_15190 [Dissulfurispiraceae bacterium]
MNDTVLAFQTSSFSAEKGSVLHTGIYNRETAAILAAGACIILLGFFFASRLVFSAILLVAALLLFVPLFLFFRTFIFIETILRVVIDRKNNAVAIMRKGFSKAERQLYPLAELENVREDYREVAAENPDGVRIVKKISLQHGTVIPGFGETAKFYTVSLEFRNDDGYRENILVFSSQDSAEADNVMKTFRKFIER